MAGMKPEALTLRASDAERERTATQLREHCAVGRLTPEELDERIDAAYAARTVGELRALLSDLPPLAATPAAPGLDPGRERAKARVLHNAGWWAIIVVICIVVWALASPDGSFWPQWVIFAAAIRMAFVSWSQLGPGAEHRRRLGRGGAAEPERLPQRPR
jgi:uncharacterized protein DUF1707